MKTGVKALTRLCLLLCTGNGFAQDCTVRHYGVNDGLSQSSVWHFLEDKNGLMWIGTGDGINFFDGYSFTVFKNDPVVPNSLNNNRIRSISQDESNQVWVGTDGGINVYDTIFKNFRNVPVISKEFPNRSERVCNIIKDKLYFYVSGYGTYSFSKSDMVLKPIDTRYNMLERINETTIINNCLWFVSGNNLCSLNLENTKLELFEIGAPDKNFSFNSYYKFDETHILIASNTGPLLFNITTHSQENLENYPALMPFQNKLINSFCVDRDYRYWIGVQGDGLYCYTQDGNLYKYYHDENLLVNSSVSFRDIRTLYADREGNIWVGTDDAGFFKISLANAKFGLTTVNTGNTYHLGSNFIKCFYKQDEYLWVGTYKKGIDIINTRTGQVNYFISKPGDQHSLCSNTISNIYPDREGNIWVITEEGLCLYNKGRNDFERIDYKERKDNNSFKPFIFEKRNGEKWVRLENGLSKLDYSEEKWHLKLFSDTLYPTAALENKNGDCILSCDSRGIVYWAGSKFQSLSSIAHWPENLSEITANCFYRDNNNIWAGTKNGLLKLDSNYHFIKLYTTRDGLPDNFIYGILSDKNNRLWMSTNEGITCFNPVNNRFRNYSVSDGLQSNEFNTGAYYKAADGEMFFGGVNGYNSFYPGRVKDNPHAPVVRLSEIKLFDMALPDGKRKNKASFNYNQNTFSFEAVGIEFTRPEDNTYAFKLEGIDNTWFYSGKKRDVRYSGIEPGSYILWAKSANADGVWSDPVVLYRFSILPPFWKTWWFVSLIALSLIGLTILITRYISQQKLKKLLAKTEREREIEKIRSRISSDIHDDIGAGLSRIAMISDKTRNEKGSSQNIDNQLDKLSKSSRELMSSLGEIVWAMNPKNDELASLLSYLRSYAYDYFEDSGIECIVSFKEKLPVISFDPEMRRNIFLIVKEAFNNTIKYAQAKQVYLGFEIKDNLALFEIRDNGTGIDPEKMRKFGNGLSNMRKRCEDIGGKFELNSMPGKGTLIRLSIDFNSIEG